MANTHIYVGTPLRLQGSARRCGSFGFLFPYPEPTDAKGGERDCFEGRNAAKKGANGNVNRGTCRECSDLLPTSSDGVGDDPEALPELVDEAKGELPVPHRRADEEDAGHLRRLVLAGGQQGRAGRAPADQRGRGCNLYSGVEGESMPHEDVY